MGSCRAQVSPSPPSETKMYAGSEGWKGPQGKGGQPRSVSLGQEVDVLIMASFSWSFSQIFLCKYHLAASLGGKKIFPTNTSHDIFLHFYEVKIPLVTGPGVAKRARTKAWATRKEVGKWKKHSEFSLMSILVILTNINKYKLVELSSKEKTK